MNASRSSSRVISENKTQPLDFTQRIEQKLARYDASDNVVKRWLFEIACWAISASSLGAIIGIYLHVSNGRLANWSTLLTLANILGKVASAALIVPTTEALGQLKWSWFHGSSKAMWDFEIFDKATRGPWGAIMLLYRTRGRSLAAMGALLIVLLLAIDTFLQQVVSLPDRWALQGEDIAGDLSRTIRYGSNPNTPYLGGVESVSDSPDLFPITRKFSDGNGTEPLLFGNGTRPEIPVSCPTSNCTWPLYDTLGVCSKCTDVSSYLTFTCLTNKVDWLAETRGGFEVDWSYPNTTHCGYFLNATSDRPVLMSGYLVQSNATNGEGETLLHRTLPLTSMTRFTPLYGNGSLLFKSLRNTIIDVIIVSSPDGTIEAVHRNATPIAQECVLTWCVKTVRSAFAWGGYVEEVVDTHFNTTPGPFPWDANYTRGELYNYTDIAYREAINIDVNSTLYGVSNATASQMIMGFTDITPAMTTSLNTTTIPLMRYMIWSDGEPWTKTLAFNPWMAPNNVTRHLERLATAMTNTIRSAKEIQILLHGDAYAREVFIQINWAWLAFPLVLLVLSLVFLVATIIKTSNDTGGAGMWKTSAMPALIYGLPKETQEKVTPAKRSKAREESKKIRIKLSPRMGWRVSGQSFRKRSSILPVSGNRAPPG
ncbi:hypothetical protein C7974DRAFT_391900 [Boeremia exigua]|uniref:uncharacterized protein n=1 Tax=Boeremia exigua TaxID=749465 RepID=UPI001E8CEC52|nr:uncharacterized protein C7974DRAFT_391900 [Boeremia exigua]KAH6632990.1 hypothetical protein C7974DRAFT_391900 [Boeremia exigua]